MKHLGLIATLIIASSVSATVVRSVNPSNAGTFNDPNSNNDVSFTFASNFTGIANITIKGTSSDNIRFVQVFGSGAGNCTAKITITGDTSQGASQVGNVRVVLKDPNSTASVNIVALNSAGNLGQTGQGEPAIKVDFIESVNISGSVLSEIQATSSRIDSFVVAGDVLAAINCNQASGRIGTIDVTGNIGSSTNTVSIGYGQRLEFLRAANMWATVASTNSTDRQIRRITTTSGAFTGSIDCFTLDDPSTSGTSGLSIAGALSANLNITTSCVEDIALASLASGKTIKIAGSMANPITISNSSGLAGQIIINSNAGAGTWTGSLSVGGSTVSGTPYYTATNLGGGAVGLAPFHYHPNESTPVDDTGIDSSTTDPVRVVWYGPLSAESANKPAKIYNRKGYGSGTWNDVTSTHTITIDSTNTRHLLVSPTTGWVSGREYKVVPNVTGSDRLLCANLITGTATPVFDDTSDPYSFYINPDIGGRSSGGGASLQEQLHAWDADPYDADDDGLTDSDDRAYIIYLYNFLNP